MIARFAFRLGLAVSLAGVSALAMAQEAPKPDAQQSAISDAAPAKTGANTPEAKVAQEDAKPDTPASAPEAGPAAGATPPETNAAAQESAKPGTPATEATPAAGPSPAASATPETNAPAPKPVQESAKPAAGPNAASGIALNAATPDPLTPPEPAGPAPKAPGAPETKPAATAQAPQPEPNPIDIQILARLAKAGGKSDAREDVAGLTAFYTENKGQPVWTGADGFNPKALKAIHEIRNAGDWGLDASAFQLPANPGAKASPEALAEAEIKLSLAVLKYARHARGGRLDPPSLSPIIDRRPHIYDPKSVLEAIAAAEFRGRLSARAASEA